MRAASRLRWRCALCGALGLTLSGCGMLGDLVSPSLLASFGVDPSTVKPAQGAIIVAFRNMTQQPATFYCFKASNAEDYGYGARNFSLEVAAGQVGNEVLDCPVEVIVPGAYTGTTAGGGAFSTVAAEVGGTVNAAVAYGGPPLTVGTMFKCGDVIEVRLVDRGAAAGGGEPGANQFVVVVQVLPG